MPLSHSEIIALTEKIRVRYAEAAKRCSPKWFDTAAFEDRLSMARRKKMDMEGFILAEIANFEKIRDRYDKKKKSKGEFTKKVDAIIEDRGKAAAQGFGAPWWVRQQRKLVNLWRGLTHG